MIGITQNYILEFKHCQCSWSNGQWKEELLLLERKDQQNLPQCLPNQLLIKLVHFPAKQGEKHFLWEEIT